MRRWPASLAALLMVSCRDQPIEHGRDASVEWGHAGGDAAGTRYSSAAQINRQNVRQLRLAWRVKSGDFPAELFEAYGHRAGIRREDGARVDKRVGAPCGYCHRMQTRFESTPLMLDGTLYVSTPRNRVLALDPGTGKKRWTFDPRIDIKRRFTEDLVSRGVATWRDDGGQPADRCRRRILLATIDARLIALDATDGVPCRGFGENGVVRLDIGIDAAAPIPIGQYAVTSPPAVVGDVVVVGSAFAKSRYKDVYSGVVRAFDVRTGKQRWAFYPIARTTDHPSRDTEPPKAKHEIGGANTWSLISTDVQRDLVFLPTASAAPDFYGGDRLGRNDFANSIVALRGSTGELLWSYQLIHHDVWDYDVAAQPMLATLRQGGRQFPALVVGTKTGMVFVLNRETGAPLLPVEERRVPDSRVIGEATWPTQPFPLTLPSLHGTMLTRDSAFGVTDEERSVCRHWIAGLSNEGIFTPPSFQGTLLWPGVWGGINWDGMAWHPDKQLLVTTVKRLGMVVRLHSRGERLEQKDDDWQPRHEYLAQEGTPYGATLTPLVAPSGTPCTPPPWGLLVAVDLPAGSIRWTRPLGQIPWLRHFRGSQNWGSIVFGGPLITDGGLVFVGASQDDHFRAFDINTGVELWDHLLPAGGQASPMTYVYGGRQYVVIAAGGRAGVGSPGDWIVAFALHGPETRSP